jgi:cyclophilin family peptidyl-prolyl cis-trans isomerase/dienelactone hydrolase
MKPHFKATLRIWLDQGGVYALANIRGGSEYGEEWRTGAKLTKRQNAYDDFAACAKYLIDQKYTNPQKLAIEGGSNGGLLMGVQLTHHPELYRAVVSHVGIYDMLRSELHPNGAFNVTEFGTVKDPDQFKALLAYSPYHNVKVGTAYPAVFLLTGANDSRVDPANSLKMAARLQATGTKLPILLQVGGSGHGLDASLSDRVLERADVYAFLFEQLGMQYRSAPQPAKSVRVLIQTDKGDIEVELDAARAPHTVANFLRYVDGKLYDGGRFHRTVKPDNQPDNKIKIEVIQAGINPGKAKAEFPPIKLERTRDTTLPHKDGIISMARDGPDTATSDFFICIGDQPELDFGGQRNPDGQGFAAFGRVVSGMEVVRSIQTAPAKGQELTPAIKILKVVRKAE